MQLSPDLQLKWQRFKSDKKAWCSFLALAFLFLISIPAELWCNIRPLYLEVDNKSYFPILFTYSEKDFGGTRPSEPEYKSKAFQRLLKGQSDATYRPSANIAKETSDETGMSLGLDDFEEDEEVPTEPDFAFDLDDFEEEGDEEPVIFILAFEDFVEDSTPSPQPLTGPSPPSAIKPREVTLVWPPVPYDYKYIPTESSTGQVALAPPYEEYSPHLERTIPSSWEDQHYLGTDDRGRDVLARLVYGFRISMIFGFSLAITGTLIGCLLGGIQGFFGGWIDLIGQRFTEIWGSIPRLYILIILSAFLTPSALILFLILNLTAWMGIAAYIRAEFLKSRNLEYVKAAKALGVNSFSIMRRHILPNSLTPVITFFPFEVTAGILSLVSLDFLNLGVPSPAPSIGELLSQGKSNLQAIWILLPTFLLLTGTLTLLTFIGDGIRNAFDPKKAL